MDISGYRYAPHERNHAPTYLLPRVFSILDSETRAGAVKRVFDLGCGNGSLAGELAGRGFQVVGVDPSREGIEQARGSLLNVQLEEGSSEDDLAAKYGHFPIVLSLEVIEHVYAPRKFAGRVWDLLEPGGLAVISTPYHGYLKNIALAVFNKMDWHWTALWDHGHIKFFGKVDDRRSPETQIRIKWMLPPIVAPRSIPEEK
jgi:2-polyprenyl-6-hydroxyphenyl methylase/3-demethylubiquinone-9 3-methyltransferase